MTLKRLIPPVLLGLTIITLLLLSAWQFQRLQWKETLMQQYEAGRAAPSENLSLIPTIALKDKTYQRVTAEGNFFHDKEVHMGGRRWFGKTGYHLYTPMQIADGRVFLINRGFIPFELKDSDKRPESLVEGVQKVSGVIRIPKQPNIMSPNNHVDKNFWFSADLPALREFTQLDLQPVIIELTAETPDVKKFPIPSEGERVFRNDHLGYALTWFMLAIAAGVIYWLRMRKEKDSTHG